MSVSDFLSTSKSLRAFHVITKDFPDTTIAQTDWSIDIQFKPTPIFSHTLHTTFDMTIPMVMNCPNYNLFDLNNPNCRTYIMETKTYPHYSQCQIVNLYLAQSEKAYSINLEDFFNLRSLSWDEGVIQPFIKELVHQKLLTLHSSNFRTYSFWINQSLWEEYTAPYDPSLLCLQLL